jgi:hypothetical protein
MSMPSISSSSDTHHSVSSMMAVIMLKATTKAAMPITAFPQICAQSCLPPPPQNGPLTSFHRPVANSLTLQEA